MEGDESGANRGDDGEAFLVLFSRALLHLTKAASRARSGRLWVQVRDTCRKRGFERVCERAGGRQGGHSCWSDNKKCEKMTRAGKHHKPAQSTVEE